MFSEEITIDNHQPSIQNSSDISIKPAAFFLSLSCTFHLLAGLSEEDRFHLQNERTHVFTPNPDKVKEVTELARIAHNTTAANKVLVEPLDLSLSTTQVVIKLVKYSKIGVVYYSF